MLTKYVGTVHEMKPIPIPHRTRATMICGTDHADACSAAPTITKQSPSRMQLRRPRGKPMIETASEQTAAANV